MRGSSQPETMRLFDEFEQLALAQHRVGEVQPRELDLLRVAGQVGELLDEPVVQRPMVLELQRAQRVRDASRGNRKSRARSRTSGRCTTCRRCGDDARAGCGYIIGSRRFMFGDAMSIFARSTCEPSGNSPARMRSNSRGSRPSADRGTGSSVPGCVSVPRYSRISSARQVVHVGAALRDQLDGALVHLLEVVGRVELARVPVEPEPAHVGCGSSRRTRRLPWSGWCRRSAGCTCRRTPRRRRSSGRSTWRARCAGSRSAPGGSACGPARRGGPTLRSSLTIWRMKSSGAAGAGLALVMASDMNGCGVFGSARPVAGTYLV